jgi:outer membrane protein assembly factor BamE (lipoprotein component of BamABCDE complex)
MSRKGILLVAVLAALALMSAACGSDTGNETGSEDERQGESADDEGASDENDAEETETDEGTGEGGAATYAATEFAFEGPDVLPAGDVTLTMDNQGKQMHELALGELLEGKTKDDVQALLTKGVPKKAPTWFRQVSGTGAAPGETGTIDAELTPGTYLMLCFVPDKASGKPHVMLGMMKEVTVE